MKPVFKQPAETVHVPVTVSGLTTLAALHDVSAASRQLVPGSAALILNPSLVAGGLMLAIGGGSSGERYLVTVLADDAEGQRRAEEMEVIVLDLAWSMPGGAAAMLSIEGFVTRFGLEETVRMTDETGTGRIGRDMLVNALIDAQAMVESHLAGRYALPLTTVPVLLEVVIADLARARLYPGGAPEGIAAAAKTAMRTLERIQGGQIAIAGAPQTGAQSEAPVLFRPGTSAYPDKLSRF